MGEIKQKAIEEMTINEVSQLLNNFNLDHNNGYIQFLEQQLEQAEYCIKKIEELTVDEIEVSIQDSAASVYIDVYYKKKKNMKW